MSALSFTPPLLATLAADEYDRRRQRARAMVANRALSAPAADRLLRPWLAIACLCGADLPELIAPIADERVVPLHPESADGRAVAVSLAEARALVAREICPRAEWAGPLTAARDAALDSLTDDSSADAIRRAYGLARIAGALAFDINGKHHVPPHAPRVRESAAA